MGSLAMYLKVLGARSEEEADAYRKEKGIIAQVVRGRQAPKPFQTFQEILGSKILMNFWDGRVLSTVFFLENICIFVGQG